MALLFVDSFDHYQTAQILSKWTENSYHSSIVVGKGRCGTQCLQMGGVQTLLKGLPFAGTPPNTGTLGFAYRIDQDYSATGAVFNISQVGNVNNDHLVLRSNGDGSLEVLQAFYPNLSLGLSAPGLINWEHWYFVEWQMVIHPVGGRVTVRLNNTVVINTAGVNTYCGTGDAILRRISFGASPNYNFKIDDLYVLDGTGPPPLNTFLGDSRVEYLRPRLPGDYEAWHPVGTASHQDAVDDDTTPDDDVTYIESNTPGDIDTSQYFSTGLPSGPIWGAQLSLYAKKSQPGPRVIAPMCNNVEGPEYNNVSFETYQYHHTPYGTNPQTGLPWTIAEINAIECGVLLVS